MKSKDQWKFAVITAFSCLIYTWNHYFPPIVISGTYVANNTEPVLEGPNYGDTLWLFRDGTVLSETWGEGTYEVGGKEIDMRFGGFGFGSSIDRPWKVGKPRIGLNYDLNFYFIKVD